MNNYIKHTIKGTVRWSVQKDGVVLRQSNSYNNLILNQGLDYVASYPFADCFKYCAVGTGISAPISSDTGLSSEVRRTNNYNIVGDANGTALVGNVYTIHRTFIFDAAVAPHTYGEVGFSPLSASGNNLFSKALIKNGAGIPITVLVGIGETLTIRYDLSIEIYDALKTIRLGITGITSPGKLRIQKIGLKSVNSLGVTEDYDDTGAANEPSVQSNIFISDSSNPPEPFGSCIDRSPVVSKTGSLSNYVSEDYSRKKGVLFTPSELASMPSFRSVGVGSASSHGLVMVFNGEQSAGSNKAYFVNFTYRWVHATGSSFTPWLDSEDALYLNKRVVKNNDYAYFAL